MSKHIVFDIDQTLIYTPSEIGWYERMVARNGGTVPESIRSRLATIVIPIDGRNSGSIRGMSGTVMMVFILRPKCVDFLKWCFNNFDTVSVWSAGSSEYVKAVVDTLFRKVGKSPHILWTYDELEDGIKPLSAMIKKVNTGAYMSVKNTLLIDDLSYNFEKLPNNGILIPPYKPMTTVQEIMADDTALFELYEWFNSDVFRSAKDVRYLNKKSIFSNTVYMQED